ncbi:hypothetical protein ACNKHW_04780 [Shigella flexneri]
MVRNWYNPNRTTNGLWCRRDAMITTIGVMIVTSLSVAREREQGKLDQPPVSLLTTG